MTKNTNVQVAFFKNIFNQNHSPFLKAHKTFLGYSVAYNLDICKKIENVVKKYVCF